MKTHLLFLVLVLAEAVYAGNIISTAGGGTRTILSTKEYYRDVVGSWDDRGTTFTEKLHCKFFRYNAIPQRIPLVVFFIAWGSDLDRSESVTQYDNMMNDPYMSVAIMPEYNGVVDNTTNWYWGNVKTDGSVKKSIPWTHNAVIALLNDIKQGKLDSLLLGNTIDTNRIYAVGASIGGTATAQIGIKHPEIFAAIHSLAGWTRYWGTNNHFFSDTRGCLAFSDLIGGIDLGTSCLTDSTVSIHGNEDQRHLPLSTSIYPAFKYTDLNWYLSKTGSAWNYRNPAFPTPFIFHTTGSLDDPTYQGDNLQPALDASKRGAMYYRPSAGHPAGGMFVHWDWLRNFRKNRSFLAFVNRSYDDFQNYSGNGYMNDLTKHGWDPETIVDDTGYYRVTLTGTGTADVTLRNLQKLQHSPGTVFNVTINGANSGQVTADEFGLITIPHVSSPATINLINPILVSIRHQNPAGSNVLNKAKLGNQIEEFSVNGKRMTTSQKRGLGVYIRQTNTTKTGQRLTINIR